MSARARSRSGIHRETVPNLCDLGIEFITDCLRQSGDEIASVGKLAAAHRSFH